MNNLFDEKQIRHIISLGKESFTVEYVSSVETSRCTSIQALWNDWNWFYFELSDKRM